MFTHKSSVDYFGDTVVLGWKDFYPVYGQACDSTIISTTSTHRCFQTSPMNSDFYFLTVDKDKTIISDKNKDLENLITTFYKFCKKDINHINNHAFTCINNNNLKFLASVNIIYSSTSTIKSGVFINVDINKSVNEDSSEYKNVTEIIADSELIQFL